MSKPEPQKISWGFERRISPTWVLTTFVQAVVLIWYVANANAEMQSRLNNLETWTRNNDQMVVRVTRLETQMTGIERGLERIEKKIDNIHQR